MLDGVIDGDYLIDIGLSHNVSRKVLTLKPKRESIVILTKPQTNPQGIVWCAGCMGKPVE